jgi:putative FmdB family regulatory protein
MTLPNYEYQCTACDHIFELWQPVGEAAPACPECGSAVKKVFHPPRVIFKGSGFYVTDLRAEKAASSNSSSGKSTPAKDAAAKDSAPASDSSSSTEKAAPTPAKSESGSSATSPSPNTAKPTPAS